MSTVDDIVNAFNIGFFSTNISTQNPINLDVTKPSELDGFKATLNVISTQANPPPPLQDIVLEGYKLDKNHKMVPTEIIVKGYKKDSFLDENGNWDVEAEAASYKERELKYKKEVIDDWLKDMGYDLQNKAELMKALLEKTEN